MAKVQLGMPVTLVIVTDRYPGRVVDICGGVVTVKLDNGEYIDFTERRDGMLRQVGTLSGNSLVLGVAESRYTSEQ